MFSAVSHKKLASAEGYFVEHLVQNDYYAAGEIRPGQWIGAGAERLGLNSGQHVTRERGEKRRKSCQVLRKASVTTHSEGGAWVFIVRR